MDKSQCCCRIHTGIIGAFMSSGNFLTGRPGSWEQRSLLGPEQQGLYQQQQQALQGKGAGGAFGTVADYYRNNLSDESADFDAFARPELRRFREDIIPGLSEQFAGMGSGGLSSSGFRNAAVNAGTDLSERLGAIRAQIRQQSAQGLNQMGQFGLGQFNENIYNAGQPGLVDQIGPAIGAAAGAFGGPALGALGTAAGQGITNLVSNKARNGQNTSSIYKGQGAG